MTLSSSAPYYEQIKEEIYTRIQRGEWKEGERLPSGLGVREGVLETRPGKGTFVKKRQVVRGFIKNTTFSEMIKEMGKKPSTKLLEYNIIRPSINNSMIIDLFQTERIGNLVILGLANEEPAILYSSYFHEELGAKIVKKAKTRILKGLPFSSYDLYEDEVRTYPKKARQTYEAIQAGKRISELLKIPRKSAVFLIKSIFYALDGKPIEYREATYRGDMFLFHVTREF
ncbi:MAG: GntR family transcriptional regulator [Deltaproteobacteria bacterium]|nr:GntR family transcriptional regulator [Deltaproteobacteria bacterium]